MQLAVGNARVLKSFVLAQPPRIVVDLADAKLKDVPAAPSGIARVRMGTSSPGKTRLVFELSPEARTPRAMHTRVTKGNLAVSFR